MLNEKWALIKLIAFSSFSATINERNPHTHTTGKRPVDL